MKKKDPELKDHDHKMDCHDKDHNRELNWRENDIDHDWYIPPHERAKGKESSSIDLEMFKSKDFLARILIGIERRDIVTPWF